MDYRIVWTETAQADLKQLVTYIAADDPIAAERFGFGLVDHVVDLGFLPTQLHDCAVAIF